MTLSRLGSVAAILGGLVWIAAAVLAWGEDAVGSVLHVVGFALLVVAFATMGYALVATAPLWLRAVVTVATPALGAMLWLTLRDAVDEPYVAVMVGGVLLLLGGGIGLGRAAPAGRGEPDASVRGRRAAR